jgi:hypothetical protein
METKVKALISLLIVAIVLAIIFRRKLKNDKKRRTIVISSVEKVKSSFNGWQNATFKLKELKSKIVTTPSWGLALITFFGTLILILVFPDGKENIAYIIFDLITATCCFLIVRENPKSIWYVPIICNIGFIIAAVAEPGFWKTTLWWGMICSGWVLTIVVSIIGARIGKRKAISDNTRT